LKIQDGGHFPPLLGHFIVYLYIFKLAEAIYAILNSLQYTITLVRSIAQDIVYAVSNRRKLTTKHVGLGLALHHATRSEAF